MQNMNSVEENSYNSLSNRNSSSNNEHEKLHKHVNIYEQKTTKTKTGLVMGRQKSTQSIKQLDCVQKDTKQKKRYIDSLTILNGNEYGDHSKQKALLLYKSQCIDKQKIIQDKDSEIDLLKADLSLREQECNELKKSSSKLEIEKSKFEESNRKINFELECAEKTISSILDDLRKANRHVKDVNEVNFTLHSKLQCLENKVQEMVYKEEVLQNTVSKLNDKILFETKLEGENKEVCHQKENSVSEKVSNRLHLEIEAIHKKWKEKFNELMYKERQLQDTIIRYNSDIAKREEILINEYLITKQDCTYHKNCQISVCQTEITGEELEVKSIYYDWLLDENKKLTDENKKLRTITLSIEKNTQKCSTERVNYLKNSVKCIRINDKNYSNASSVYIDSQKKLYKTTNQQISVSKIMESEPTNQSNTNNIGNKEPNNIKVSNVIKCTSKGLKSTCNPKPRDTDKTYKLISCSPRDFLWRELKN